MFLIWKIWRALFSCNTRFEIRSFVLLPTSYFSSETGYQTERLSRKKLER